VELEGGVWTGGGHTRGKIFNANCDKYNAAAALGWVVLRFTTDHLHKNPVGVVDLVSNMLKRNGATP
jgi:very-short-patch-repair endonuclease